MLADFMPALERGQENAPKLPDIGLLQPAANSLRWPFMVAELPPFTDRENDERTEIEIAENGRERWSGPSGFASLAFGRAADLRFLAFSSLGHRAEILTAVRLTGRPAGRILYLRAASMRRTAAGGAWRRLSRLTPAAAIDAC